MRSFALKELKGRVFKRLMGYKMELVVRHPVENFTTSFVTLKYFCGDLFTFYLFFEGPEIEADFYRWFHHFKNLEVRYLLFDNTETLPNTFDFIELHFSTDTQTDGNTIIDFQNIGCKFVDVSQLGPHEEDHGISLLLCKKEE